MKKLPVIVACVLLLIMAGVLMVNGAILVQSGWENSHGTDPSDSGTWTVFGSPYIVTSPIHSGQYACAFWSSNDQLCYSQFAPVSSLQISAWVYFDNLPLAAGGQTFVVWVYDSETNCEAVVDVINVGGTIYWGCEDNTGVSLVSNIVATSGTWHNVVLEGYSGTPFAYSAWIDGVQIANNYEDSTYSSPHLNYALIGGWHKGQSVTVFIDDVYASSEPLPLINLPEYSFGGLLAIVACFAAFVVVWKRGYKRQK
jgi:hypothetical protein